MGRSVFLFSFSELLVDFVINSRRLCLVVAASAAPRSEIPTPHATHLGILLARH